MPPNGPDLALDARSQNGYQKPERIIEDSAARV